MIVLILYNLSLQLYALIIGDIIIVKPHAAYFHSMICRFFWLK